MRISNETCKTCTWKGADQNGGFGCYLTHLPIKPEKDFCSHFTTEPAQQCPRCGTILTPFTPQVYIEEELIVVCENCALRARY